MRTYALKSLATLAALAAAAAACSPDGATTTSPSLAASGAKSADDAVAGAVYTLDNGAASNHVIAFRRDAAGALTPIGSFDTGGAGTGGTTDPLASQYALVLSDDHRLLFAVDAGSDEVSSFRVAADGSLSLADKVSSGGDLPVSLAVHGRLLYALDAGDNTLQGYRAAASGQLVALPHARVALAAGASGAAAVRFTTDGRWLVVSERVSNRLETFPVLPDGRLGAPVVSASSGNTPFGFDVTPSNDVIVSEAGSAAASSYALGAGGTLGVVTASLGTGGRAPCWLIATADGRYAYTANAGTGTITGFAVSSDGHLSLLTAGGATGVTGAGSTPLDLDLAAHDRLLYVLESGAGAVGGFAVGADGGLTPIGTAPAGAPASGLQGLAAY
jgi:6-phosphogluconolactonase (cycloisomerase 2 family)